MVDSIGTKLGNINGEKFRMTYINVKYLVRFYDEDSIINILSFKDVSSILGTRIKTDAVKEKAIVVELNIGEVFKFSECSNFVYFLIPIRLIITLKLKTQLTIMLRLRQFQRIQNSL